MTIRVNPLTHALEFTANADGSVNMSDLHEIIALRKWALERSQIQHQSPDSIGDVLIGATDIMNWVTQVAVDE